MYHPNDGPRISFAIRESHKAKHESLCDAVTALRLAFAAKRIDRVCITQSDEFSAHAMFSIDLLAPERLIRECVELLERIFDKKVEAVTVESADYDIPIPDKSEEEK